MASVGFTGTMPRPRPIDRRGHRDAGLIPPPRAPLIVLNDWPTACRPDSSCEVSDTVYPAPDSLDLAEVQWWIDITEIRVNASRNLLNNAVAAVLGALIAAAATATAALISSSPWAAALTGIGSVLVVLLAGRTLLKDSDHAPLEQRLMLYRQRARDLEAAGQTPGHPLVRSPAPTESA